MLIACKQRMLDVLETLGWFLLWLLILWGVHYQFKVCIPVTVACLKITESFVILLLIKMFVFFQLYGSGHGIEILKNTTLHMVGQAKAYATKLDL